MTLARRTYAQAIAWWGARLAEALQHAHDRQVLHRDVKPSNVLMSDDGLPMLLDFNLRKSPCSTALEAAEAGVRGTLAYMTPRATAKRSPRVARTTSTARSDLYALGVVLFDCLVRGTRSFALPSEVDDDARRLASHCRVQARHAPRGCGTTHPDVPPALEAVVRRCLAPDPSDRYESAAQLAADLQAVADDGAAPLRARADPEPLRPLDPQESPPAGCRRAPHPGSGHFCLLPRQRPARRAPPGRRGESLGRHRLDDRPMTVSSSSHRASSRWPFASRKAISGCGRWSNKSRRKTVACGRPRSSGTRLTSCSRQANASAFSLLGFSGDSKVGCRSR